MVRWYTAPHPLGVNLDAYQYVRKGFQIIVYSVSPTQWHYMVRTAKGIRKFDSLTDNRPSDVARSSNEAKKLGLAKLREAEKKATVKTRTKHERK